MSYRTISILIFVVTVFLAINDAWAVTLNIQDAVVDAEGGAVTTVDVEITVDDPTEIAGAAFTVVYDTSALDLTRISSEFFDTFANQFLPIAPGAPTSVTIDSVDYDQPLLAGNEINQTGTMVAGARVLAGGINPVLFTLTFDISNATDGKYNITRQPSVINNATGSDTSLPRLVGTDTNEADLTQAFAEVSVDSISSGNITVQNNLEQSSNDTGLCFIASGKLYNFSKNYIVSTDNLAIGLP